MYCVLLTLGVLRNPEKIIMYLYNYSSGAWIKVTSYAKLGCDRVCGECGGGERARAGTVTLPGCDSATLEPSAPCRPRLTRPRALTGWHAHARPRPPKLPPPTLYLVQNLISLQVLAKEGTELKYEPLTELF